MLPGDELGVCSLQGGDGKLSRNVSDCMVVDSEGRDDGRMKFSVYNQKSRHQRWVSASLLLRKLCATT